MLGDWGWIETETRNLECPGPKDMRVKLYHTDLGGGFKHFDYFPFHIWDVILPIDELIFFKMVKTTNQLLNAWLPS